MNKYNFGSNQEKIEEFIRQIYRDLYCCDLDVHFLAEQTHNNVVFRWTCPICRESHQFIVKDDNQDDLNVLRICNDFAENRDKSKLRLLIESKIKGNCPSLQPKGRIGF